MFAKVFTQILDSSLAEDYRTRHVFEDLLKLCDINGVVDMTPESIARRTNVPLEIVVHGLSVLEKPDPESRNPQSEGRRIIRLDEHRTWGWFIVNYEHYRRIASEDQRREKTRLRVQRHSERAKANAMLTVANAPNAKQRQRQRERKKQTISNVNLVKEAQEAPLTKLTLASAASMHRIAREIARDERGWSYDNCKVQPDQIVSASLETILVKEEFTDKLSEETIHACWKEAVVITHQATVDGMANNPPAYCVECFKEQLTKAVKRENPA